MIDLDLLDQICEILLITERFRPRNVIGAEGKGVGNGVELQQAGRITPKGELQSAGTDFIFSRPYQSQVFAQLLPELLIGDRFQATGNGHFICSRFFFCHEWWFIPRVEACTMWYF